MGQIFVEFIPKVLVTLDALHLIAIERESLTSGSGNKRDYFGFG